MTRCERCRVSDISSGTGTAVTEMRNTTCRFAGPRRSCKRRTEGERRREERKEGESGERDEIEREKRIKAILQVSGGEIATQSNRWLGLIQPTRLKA